MAGRMLFCDVDTQVDFMLPSGSLYVHGAEPADIAWDGSGADPAAVADASEVVLPKKRFDGFSNPATPVVIGALEVLAEVGAP